MYTELDFQLVGPNHMLYDRHACQCCEKCLSGSYLPSLRGRCIHGSRAKSMVGAAEAAFWRMNGAYRYIDVIICCSAFLKTKMDTNPLFAGKTVVMHNFVDKTAPAPADKKDYILYFGRFSREKGIRTLLDVCRELPELSFVFAGSGPLEGEVNGAANVRNVGFQRGEALEKLIREARFSVYPSEWYENCPFSVMESQMLGTPVLGARIGGIPELIRDGETGELFESGSREDLKAGIRSMLAHSAAYSANCRRCGFDTVEAYSEKLMNVYTG